MSPFTSPLPKCNPAGHLLIEAIPFPTSAVANIHLILTTYFRVIRRIITMLFKQATLEASNEALTKQAEANAKNADLVEKVKKESRVRFSSFSYVCVLSSMRTCMYL